MALILFDPDKVNMFKKPGLFITLRSVLLMTLMLLVLFNVNLVRVIKDDLILTFLGAEIISFIKLWVEIPVTSYSLDFLKKVLQVQEQEGC